MRGNGIGNVRYGLLGNGQGNGFFSGLYHGDGDGSGGYPRGMGFGTGGDELTGNGSGNGSGSCRANGDGRGHNYGWVVSEACESQIAFTALSTCLTTNGFKLSVEDLLVFALGE